MHILGISALYHDSAACLVRDGEIIAAAQEERFTRRKHDAAMPVNAIRYCLREAGIRADDLDFVGFYEKPFRKFDRLMETYLGVAPRGFESFRAAVPSWLGDKLWLPPQLQRAIGASTRRRYVFVAHHESHAASAFFPSPFEEAAIVTLDGVGEWSTTTIGRGSGARVAVEKEIRFPHSLGLLYSAFTAYTGFEINEGEYKVMGLAPYGEPRFYSDILGEVLHLKDDGSFWLDMSYFNYLEGLTMTSEKFHRRFGGAPRESSEPITQRHMDLAASIQRVTEDVMIRIAKHAREVTGSRNLCLAGGVALNCVANGRILRELDFERIWIQPAAGDAGGALGTALFIWHQLLEKPRVAQSRDAQRGSLLGPANDANAVQEELDRLGANYTILDEPELLDRAARLIADGKIVGWVNGRMEFGPRALGARSILGDARNPVIQTAMNVKVKYRESFRPFAPSVLSENAADYFEMKSGEESPYMLLVAPVRLNHRKEEGGRGKERGFELLRVVRSDIPAATHVDFSARVQTVDVERFPRYRALIERFRTVTGSPVIVNTSFNLSWEPIVESAEQALRTFMSCDMDALVIENALLIKREQRANLCARRLTAGIESDPALEQAWCCPKCGGALQSAATSASCLSCGQRFEKVDGVWRLFWPHAGADSDVTSKVAAFYEENPFPNYDEHESLQSLIAKSRRGVYAKLLFEQLPFNADVLEVGCGTGQLSNFLGISCRSVTGVDLSLSSLRLAEGFRQKHGLERVRFAQMNLFQPALRASQYDIVLCNSVLHHTSDPERGFQQILRLVRPGGFVVVGLYHRYGRLALAIRRVLFRMTGDRGHSLDPHVRSEELSEAKRSAWFADQYRHPHASTHTEGQVKSWFRRAGVDFVSGIPRSRFMDDLDDATQLFAPATRAGGMDRILSPFGHIISGSREGGVFVVIGRKRSA